MRAVTILLAVAFALWFAMLCEPIHAYFIDDAGERFELVADEPVASAAGTSPAPMADAGVERWRWLVISIFGVAQADRVLRVMQCESHGDPNATGAVGERGLLQIHPIHSDSTYDPEGNLRAAFRISDGGRTFAAWAGGRGDAWAAGSGC